MGACVRVCVLLLVSEQIDFARYCLLTVTSSFLRVMYAHIVLPRPDIVPCGCRVDACNVAR